MRRGFISMKPHFRAFLKNVTKQAVIAAVHLAQGLVNHHQHIKDIDVAVAFAVWSSRWITAVGRYSVGHIPVVYLARRPRLQPQHYVKPFQYVQYIHYAVTAIRVSARTTQAILGINIAAGLEAHLPRKLAGTQVFVKLIRHQDIDRHKTGTVTHLSITRLIHHLGNRSPSLQNEGGWIGRIEHYPAASIRLLVG